MECVKCQKQIQDDFLFCPWCGWKQSQQLKKYRKRANGSGTIYKREGNLERPWIAKKSNIYVGAFKTRAEAQKALERLTDTSLTDKYNITFAEAYRRWFETHSREITDKTRKDYEWVFNICQPIHDRKIRSILRSDYQALIIEQEQKGRSKGTCHKLKVVLGMIGNWAYEEGITLTNNADGLNTVAKQLKEREIFLEADITAIQEAGIPAADIALILISCGCRPGELFQVPLSDCFEDYFIGGSKTEAGKNRVIPIGTDGLAAWQKLRDKAIAEKCSRLIDAYDGSHVYANYAKREWKKLMERIGREEMTPYVCRHTFITNAIRGGMDLPVLEAIVGHMDRETTRIYTHLRAGDLVDAVQGLKTEPFAVVNKLSTCHNPQISFTQEKLAK